MQSLNRKWKIDLKIHAIGKIRHIRKSAAVSNFMKDINSNNLQIIPGVGKSIAKNPQNIGIYSVADLKGKDPQELYDKSNKFSGRVQDKCLLYVLCEAVYFAKNKKHNPEKLKWWNWKDK